MKTYIPFPPFIHTALSYVGYCMVFVVILTGCKTTPSQETQATQKPPEILQVPHLPYLLQDSSIYDHFEIDETGLSMYAHAADKKEGKVECKIYPDEYDSFKALLGQLSEADMQALYLKKGSDYLAESIQIPPISTFEYGKDSLRPLAGLRIAIDPGHIAATIEHAILESKVVQIQGDGTRAEPEIAFNEANLTLATAFLLADKLEAQGAEILMTRTEAGHTCSGETYKEWKRNSFEKSLRRSLDAGRMDFNTAQWWREEATEKDLYRRLFVPIDLRARAEKINAFHPHLTVIIHYNVHIGNWLLRDENEFFKPGEGNYNMVFVGGSFMKGELSRLEDRLDFLRMLLTDDIPASIDLSHRLLTQFNEKLGVRTVTDKDNLSYLNKACVKVQSGIYARNLTLTRMVNGPLCYGESICQDHKDEAPLLNQKDQTVHGIAYPKRIEKVADAYYDAVLGFVQR